MIVFRDWAWELLNLVPSGPMLQIITGVMQLQACCNRDLQRF